MDYLPRHAIDHNRLSGLRMNIPSCRCICTAQAIDRWQAVSGVKCLNNLLLLSSLFAAFVFQFLDLTGPGQVEFFPALFPTHSL